MEQSASQKGNIDIPVILDDIKRYIDFRMARCVYFVIECDEPSPGWTLGLNENKIPFFLLNISGIIYKPSPDIGVFESLVLIDNLFDLIESHPSLYVDTNEIWLPNMLLRDNCKRGDVYRVNQYLFLHALDFKNNKISEDEFDGICHQSLKESDYSRIETESFRLWADKQIYEAKQIYPKNANLELRWQQMSAERV